MGPHIHPDAGMKSLEMPGSRAAPRASFIGPKPRAPSPGWRVEGGGRASAQGPARAFSRLARSERQSPADRAALGQLRELFGGIKALS